MYLTRTHWVADAMKNRHKAVYPKASLNYLGKYNYTEEQKNLMVAF